ncbi:TetR family transcriptional regulator [Actinocorallia herbida]|uniref:TetR family transcriptional regulator n=1 Tax=Actinocorallia herbida TaxID=58109 RepID=A0A3N1CV83_9ACTN|nr:TetR/AcrR family transcriptional regulator [Actinocorallia herbida]ROO85134.1 TetR family transcriptional regulator [Actinocorallia herbida]
MLDATRIAFVAEVFDPVDGPRDDTDRRILDAARAEFVQMGIRRARVEEIARRAGVARVTVHRRFVGKERLLNAVLVEEARRSLSLARARIEAAETVPEKVATGFVLALAYAREGDLSALLRNDTIPPLPGSASAGDPVVLLIRAFLLQVLYPPGQGPRQLLAADTLARLVVSHCLYPDPALGLDDPAAAAGFARDHLAPIITAAPPLG